VNDEALILNVDDYPANLYVRSGILRKAGYRVIEANSGREALDRIVADRPDLVVLDVQMPDIDGLEVCRRVRSTPDLASLLILHVSATATTTDSVVLGLDNGADGYLTDAVSPEVILATVRSLLRMRRAEEERNDAQRRLAETEGRVSRLMENLTDVVYRLRLRPDRAFEYVSPAVATLTGYSPEEYYADSELAAKLVYPEDLPALDGLRHFQGGSRSIVLRWRCRDGRLIWTEHRVFGIRDAQGRLLALEGVARDITGQKQVEDELRRANRLKDEFLATLSHELRTPLNAIVGWSQMLQSGKLTADLRERAVDAIARNAMSQRQLINDVLDVSRIVTGKMRIEPRLFDVSTALNAAMDSFRPAAEAKGIEMVLTRPAAAVPLMGDPDRLQQVFWNLLSNAVKFTPPGGRITVRLHTSDSTIVVEVEDSGAGIPSWFLPHIFERFSQVDSAMNRQHHGLGLGLALVRHLVELHGGTVEGESQGEGQGTTIRVTLPLGLDFASVPDEPVAAKPASAGKAAASSVALSGLRVLFVDDESDSRQVIGAVLRHAGAEVTEADCARTALALLPLVLPDIVLSDIGMPGQDGIEFIRLLRTLPKEAGGEVPAVALTAYGRDEDRQKALEAGYDLHVSKPILPEDLTRQLAELAHNGRVKTNSRS
jgi:PAS domain S-box-containing protein